MDYKKFLGQTKTEVLPYLGGASVDARSRHLRVARQVAPGWWRFSIRGRNADPLEACEPADLAELPAVRGHLVGPWLFSSGHAPARVELLPNEELEPLAWVIARRWSETLLVFDAPDFEGDAESAAREALDALAPLAGIQGVAASLRAAYGWALIAKVAAARNVPVAHAEVAQRLRELASGGREGADAIVDGLEERRREARAAIAARHAVHRARERERTVEGRVTASLDAAGATLRRLRSLGDGTVEVRFWYMQETFVSVVDVETLQVLDAGICLDGADRVTNLRSLPAVIREAIDTNQLCITRT